ncbi:MAG: hypothetical protein PHI71_00565 [Acidiphilium sp.]|nr:hypothetical protein [Acidiphilium sp.]
MKTWIIWLIVSFLALGLIVTFAVHMLTKNTQTTAVMPTVQQSNNAAAQSTSTWNSAWGNKENGKQAPSANPFPTKTKSP